MLGTLVANTALNAGICPVIWALSPELLGKTNNTASEITFCDASDRALILDLLTNKVNVVPMEWEKEKQNGHIIL